jgi:hypothetical protein
MKTEYELRESIRRMREASSRFYGLAIQTDNHAFIEFTGFMNEYIAVCQHALDQGMDFTEFNTHSGKAIPIESYQGDYIGEKFDCIFGPWFRAQPDAWRAFKSRIENKGL